MCTTCKIQLTNYSCMCIKKAIDYFVLPSLPTASPIITYTMGSATYVKKEIGKA